ncbi:MAG: 3-phosphoshikimate 1-carboxyvinyltransferase [Phycisphaerales bacterium]|nr:3-phosphoshikimate 1-carboxyvinyltransferase [Phycisphaerales bacterium]
MTQLPPNLDLDSLPDRLALPEWSRTAGKPPLDVTIRPPGSKSLTNRALLLAALSCGESVIEHPLVEADDAQRMLGAIQNLGATVKLEGSKLTITGTGGVLRVDPNDPVIDLNNAGTATRFLSAAALLADHPITITGNARMQERPIRELGDLLTQLGAEVEYLKSDGCPPIRITPPKDLTQMPTRIEIQPTQSSQFVSALMLVAPSLPNGLTISQPNGITSESYVRMTIELLDSIGVRVQHSGDLSTVRISPPSKRVNLEIEPDASGATYWWTAGALLPDSLVRVQGLDLEHANQGDARFPLLLEQMGCTLVSGEGTLACRGRETLSPIMCDMRDMPDAVMSLAIAACFAGGTTIIRGVRTLRVKECDRIEALKVELAKIGVEVTDNLGGDDDALSITPPRLWAGFDSSNPIVMHTYDDHRMAMSLSLLALRLPGIVIDDPKCVAKTYPGFYQDLARVYDITQ